MQPLEFMNRLLSRTLVLGVLLPVLHGCSARPVSGPPPVADPVDELSAGGPITPVPAQAKFAPARVELGRRLFLEPRLSHDDSLACAGCHPLDRGGMDGRARSPGANGVLSPRNTPTVFNAALNFRQFWDGRADSLERQIDGSVNNPDELGSSWAEVVQKLGRDPSYVTAFAAVYGRPVTPEGVRDAIATFERTLIYRRSRFDLFLAGDTAAMTMEEKQGFELFQEFGCASCHQGANVGGNMFERMGVIGDFFAGRGDPSDSDLGRFSVTGRPEDRFVFRVPSLRLVSLTAPYLHDGSIATLRETVTAMARHQLGRRISDAEARLLELFLQTLPGVPEGSFGAAPR